MQNPVQAGSKKNRRSFLKQSVVGVGGVGVGVGVGVGLPPTNLAAQNGPQKLTKGDIAILTFLSALEEVEADLWIQYAKLGGATNQGLSPIVVHQKRTKQNRCAKLLKRLSGEVPEWFNGSVC
jgi:hypothetical protein